MVCGVLIPGPSSPDSKLFPTISIIESKISGAEDPNAIRVRLATVPFQTGISITSGLSILPEPSADAMWIFFVVLDRKKNHVTVNHDKDFY